VSAVFEVEQLLANVTPDRRYHEFLRVSAMSSGLYVLPAGATDRQSPHKEDETYYVVRGRGKIRIGDKETPVTQGSVVFVEANAEHRFFDIEEDLVLLVVFAPAESG
jgi:mannose-6-phosphate isomerase-like protein (cupin superfamily)